MKNNYINFAELYGLDFDELGDSCFGDLLEKAQNESEKHESKKIDDQVILLKRTLMMSVMFMSSFFLT